MVRGSALQALEGVDESCIDRLLQALDNVPEPDRHDVAFVVCTF